MNENAIIGYWNEGRNVTKIAEFTGESVIKINGVLINAGIEVIHRPNFQNNTIQMFKAINAVLNKYAEIELTVRQIYYQLAGKYKVVPLTDKGYTKVQRDVDKGRKYGVIDENRIADLNRQPYIPNMWSTVSKYYHDVIVSWRETVWKNQSVYFEVWLEKKALISLIEPVTSKYGIILQPTVGYPSTTIVKDAKRRGLKDGDTIFYLGDHDASGVDIDRSIRDKFEDEHKMHIELKRVGLKYKDIKKYQIPTNPIKDDDKRSNEYKIKYNKQAELDALPPDILLNRLKKYIENPKFGFDMGAYEETLKHQEKERNRLKVLDELLHTSSYTDAKAIIKASGYWK